MLQYKRRRKVLITIEPFHMTSRPPHTLVTQNNETAAILVIWELNLHLMLKLLLVAINSLSCWPREWKRFIDHWPHYTLMWDLRRETNATICLTWVQGSRAYPSYTQRANFSYISLQNAANPLSRTNFFPFILNFRSPSLVNSVKARQPGPSCSKAD